MSSKSCVGPWAKAGLVFSVLAIGWILWVGGRVTGWHFEMGNVAKRLRRECLRKGMELGKGESTDKDRLEALVRELLQEKVGEDERSPEALAYEKMVLDSIIERIRC
jgi:hypothetical protein